MKKMSTEALDAYLKGAQSWAQDRQESLRASRRVAWIVAAVAIAVALCLAVALMLLMPLKRVEPYTLLVDRQTGFVQLLKPLDPQMVSSDAALTQSFLVQYVIAREGFDINSLQADYRKVGLWSTGQARADYLSLMPATNPASPLATYPRSTVVSARVKSVSALGPKSALVRFDTVRQDVGRQPAAPQPWVAVIRYDYANAPMSVEDRYVNPLGFQVRSYRRNAEALPPEPTPAPSPTLVPQAAPATVPGVAPSTAPGGVVIPPRRAAQPAVEL
ncbi:MAG: type IV secretion system protein [Sphingomonas sp.]|uniref:virB8 family protein n=1 Tax=Sphingomonas sp. TaxID=28214 RepID=UPI001B2E8EC9|nr:type IV secretion system protein [Sphingomonas sp.]MBO9622408.1 type IV secretion system protein [Sphingomonas sp.]